MSSSYLGINIDKYCIYDRPREVNHGSNTFFEKDRKYYLIVNIKVIIGNLKIFSSVQFAS
jgi:hypothetical protein